MSGSLKVRGTGISERTGVEFGDLLSEHSDERRKIGTLFAASEMQQVKLIFLQDAGGAGGFVLGGHMHPYGEMFTISTGIALFRVFTHDLSVTEYYLLVPGKRIVLPKNIPHDAFVTSHSVLIGATENAYHDLEHNIVVLPIFNDDEKNLLVV